MLETVDLLITVPTPIVFVVVEVDVFQEGTVVYPIIVTPIADNILVVII